MTGTSNPDQFANAHRKGVPPAFILMPILTVVGFVLGLVFGARGSDLILLTLTLFTALLALVPIAAEQQKPASDRHILLILFCAFFAISFVTPVFVIYLPTTWPVDAPSYDSSNLFPEDVIRGQLATILGFLCMLIGYTLPLGRRFAVLIPQFRRDWSLGETLAVACVIIPLGWAVLLAGLIGAFSSSYGAGLLGVVAMSYTYGVALLAIAWLRYQSKLAVLLLAMAIPLTAAFGLLTGSKGATLMAGVMVVLAIIVLRRKLAARWILAGILASSLVYPVGVFVRVDILRENTLTAVNALQNPSDTWGRISAFLSSNRFGDYFLEGIISTVARLDSLGAVSVIVRDTPRIAPFQHGRTLALFFIAFVPRAVWPDKPATSIGEYITDVYGAGPGAETSTAPTEIGDFFLNFGYPGVVAGMMLFGILLRIAHEVLIRGRPTTPALFVAIIVLRTLVLDFEGNVGIVWSQAVMSIIPVIIVHQAIRLLSRPVTQSPGDELETRPDAEFKT